MEPLLAVDFGSTYTKAVLFDIASAGVVATAQSPSTVATDVTIGLGHVLEDLSRRTGIDLGRVRALACSSAAGGLRVAVSGLVPALSLEAARRAALGAGAKIVSAHGFKLTARTLAEIEATAPDIVLLAGGTNGGDEEVILHNAGILARSKMSTPVIVAGNECVTQECVDLLAAAGKPVRIARNLLPEVGRIDVESVHATIRELFITGITHAKGIDRVATQLELAADIVPTPAAVLEAARLLAQGSGSRKGFGDTVVVDVGGATTDVHSAASGAPSIPGVVQRGLPELWLKRTVEGDLGMRINAQTIVERYGRANLAQLANAPGSSVSLDEAAVDNYVGRVGQRTEHVPADTAERALDKALARAAVQVAMSRHAGSLREVYTPTGSVTVQEGKDLGETAAVIGVGGVLARGEDPRFILEGALAAGDPQSLLPRNPALYLDRKYILFGIGLLAGVNPDAAAAIACEYLERLPRQT
ncbi:MAG TPA: methylaspartate mutase accessory protein GlmL [Ramlibacter sp.]|jgi:uncharacterized protein (TIGR01319 family)